MKIYISIPITGKCEQTQRAKAKKWQAYFEKKGFEVVNPFDLADRLNAEFAKLGKVPEYDDYMELDLKHLDECTHIFVCNGWAHSKGCKIEIQQAYENKLKFIFEGVLLS